MTAPPEQEFGTEQPLTEADPVIGSRIHGSLDPIDHDNSAGEGFTDRRIETDIAEFGTCVLETAALSRDVSAARIPGRGATDDRSRLIEINRNQRSQKKIDAITERIGYRGLEADAVCGLAVRARQVTLLIDVIDREGQKGQRGIRIGQFPGYGFRRLRGVVAIIRQCFNRQ